MDRALPAALPLSPVRPRSAVGDGVGLCGLLGVVGWVALARRYGLPGPYGALVMLAACALPMVAWSVLVDRVHRRASTGIDWSRERRGAAVRGTAPTKLAGLWATWAVIGTVYATARFYWQGDYLFAMWCLTTVAPALFVLSIPYVLWLDRYLVEPRDGAWHLGAWLSGQAGSDPRAIADHARAWAVKGFFLAFMLSVLPGVHAAVVAPATQAILRDPAALAGWGINAMFLVDVCVATVGYVLTLRPLDAQIRSANPHAQAWVAALICYPPFMLMGAGGPLDYRPGTADWQHWFAASPLALAAIGAVLVVLAAIYAWATLAFGLRFSNLTHRGIVTHGPYAWVRHPAYLSKNLFWWIAAPPLLSTLGPVEAVRATLLLALVSGVYWWRTRTEERHLATDPAYRAYAGWIARHGLLARLRGRLRKWLRGG